MKPIRISWLLAPILGISILIWTQVRADPPAQDVSANFWRQFHDKSLSVDLSNGKSVDGTLAATVFINENLFLGIKTKAAETPLFVNAHQIVSFHQAP